MRALVVEDDPTSADLITASIEPHNFVVEHTDSGEDALELVKVYDFDVAVLAGSLTDMSGAQAVRQMRQANVKIPAIVLCAGNDAKQKVEALKAGADDCLAAPFDVDELIARLHSIVRRAKGHADSVIRTGRMAIDLASRTVEIDGKPLRVTGKEYGILELLALRKGMTLTKDTFLDHLYGGMDEPEQKIIDVFICKLRKKIADLTPDYKGIETVWGRGYVLKDQPGSNPQLAEEGDPFLFDIDGAGANGHDDLGELEELDLLLLQLIER
ncbi:MAG: response regulator transcription factor [Geminicoccaceae bacterium]